LMKSVALEEDLLFNLYEEFEESFRSGVREYTDACDEVREVFVRGNSLSRRETASVLQTVRGRLRPITGKRADLMGLLDEYAAI